MVEPKPETEVWDFDETTDRGREVVPGVDGTASWPGDGSVGIRFPLEAGTGIDGRVSSWPRGEDPSDLHASRLIVPPSITWDLSERKGLVVLRSQGPFEVAGTLKRTVRPETKSIAASLRGPDRRFLADAGSLEDWLVRAREQGEDWTVLITGGDLRVGGSIEVDGPLLVIAGGWIRVDGRVVAKEIWKSPEGGENAVAEEPVRVAPFRWQSPKENPLVEPLRFAVLSNLFRPEGGVLRWGAANVDGESGQGRFRVRFLGLRDFGPHGPELIGPLDDPTLLSDCDAVRFLVELEVDPAEGPWSPPRVDRVALQWSVDSDGGDG